MEESQELNQLSETKVSPVEAVRLIMSNDAIQRVEKDAFISSPFARMNWRRLDSTRNLKRIRDYSLLMILKQYQDEISYCYELFWKGSANFVQDIGIVLNTSDITVGDRALVRIACAAMYSFFRSNKEIDFAQADKYVSNFVGKVAYEAAAFALDADIEASREEELSYVKCRLFFLVSKEIERDFDLERFKSLRRMLTAAAARIIPRRRD